VRSMSRSATRAKKRSSVGRVSSAPSGRDECTVSLRIARLTRSDRLYSNPTRRPLARVLDQGAHHPRHRLRLLRAAKTRDRCLDSPTRKVATASSTTAGGILYPGFGHGFCLHRFCPFFLTAHRNSSSFVPLKESLSNYSKVPHSAYSGVAMPALSTQRAHLRFRIGRSLNIVNTKLEPIRGPRVSPGTRSGERVL
jgi:hypothetical protein